MKYLENIKESKYVKYGKIESNFKPTVLIYKNINTIPLALSMRNSFNKFSIFRTLRLPNVDLSRVLESFIFEAHPTVSQAEPQRAYPTPYQLIRSHQIHSTGTANQLYKMGRGRKETYLNRKAHMHKYYLS